MGLPSPLQHSVRFQVRAPFSTLPHPSDQATSSLAVGGSEGTLFILLNRRVMPFQENVPAMGLSP